MVSAKADLPSCVWGISEVRHRCVSGLNSLAIPLSSGGFVLFRLSLTFLRELDTGKVRRWLGRRRLKMKDVFGAFHS